jgi:hypothetical protein
MGTIDNISFYGIHAEYLNKKFTKYFKQNSTCHHISVIQFISCYCICITTVSPFTLGHASCVSAQQVVDIRLRGQTRWMMAHAMLVMLAWHPYLVEWTLTLTLHILAQAARPSIVPLRVRFDGRGTGQGWAGQGDHTFPCATWRYSSMPSWPAKNPWFPFHTTAQGSTMWLYKLYSYSSIPY